MCRSAFIMLLLAGSPALAGQARAVMQVGITITGGASQAPAKSLGSGSRDQAVSNSLAGSGAAATTPSGRTRLRSAK